MIKKRDFSWANGSIDDITTMLAKRASMVKYADPPPTEAAVPPDVAAAIADAYTGTGALRDIKPENKPSTTLADALKWGLGGAGIGALVGGVSSLAVPEKKRRATDDIATGALIGGLGGTGVGLAKNIIFDGPPDDKKGGPEHQLGLHHAATLAAARQDRQKFEGGFWGSRARDFASIIPRTWRAATRGGDGGLAEAGRTADIFGLRHFTDKTKGDPITGMYGRGGFLWPASFGTFHADLAASQGVVDLALKYLKRSWNYHDPSFVREALANKDLVNKYIPDTDLATALHKKVSSLPTPQLIRFLKNRNVETGAYLGRSGFQLEHEVKPDFIHYHATQALTPDMVRQVAPTLERFQETVRKLRDARMEAFIHHDAKQNIIIDQAGQLIKPSAGMTDVEATAYSTRLAQIDQKLATLLDNGKRINVPPQQLAGHMYEAATRLGSGGIKPLAVISELERLSTNHDLFNRYTQTVDTGRGGRGANPIDVAAHKIEFPVANNQTGFRNITLAELPAMQVSQDDLRNLGRPDITPEQHLRLQLQNLKLEGTMAKARDALLRDPNLRNIIAAARPSTDPNNPAKGWMFRDVTLPDQTLYNLVREHRQLRDQQLRTEQGLTRRFLFGGYGGRGYDPMWGGDPNLSPARAPVVSNPLPGEPGGEYVTGHPNIAGAGAALRGNRVFRPFRHMVGLAGKVPRVGMYLGPTILQEWLYHRGNRAFRAHQPYGPYDAVESTLDTPEKLPYVDASFEANAQRLAELLGPGQNTVPPDLWPRERLMVNRTLEDSAIDDATRTGRLRYILGLTGNSYRPYRY